MRPARAGSAGLAALLAWVFAAHATTDPRALLPEPGTYELPPIARVDDFTLLDTTGAGARIFELAPGQVAVVALIYTSCPSACPAALAVMQQVDRAVAQEPELARDVRLVTVSFDPAVDTPAKMAALRAKLEPRSRWRFLTAADRAGIEPVLASFGQDALRLVVPGQDTAASPLYRHVMKVFLVDASRDVRNIYSTGVLSPEVVLTDVRTLLLEAKR